jgi:hypothetical protein
MIEEVKELSVESQLYSLVHREPLGNVKIAPEEVGAAQSVAAKISELAVLRVVAPVAGSSSWIDHRNKRVWIEPLNCSGLGNARNVAMATIGIYSGHKTCKLWTAALHDAISIR